MTEVEGWELGQGEKRSLNKFLAALDELRDLDPGMASQTVHALLLIARKPGMHKDELAKLLGVSPAAATRITQRLGAEGVKTADARSTGLGFVTQKVDVMDRRYS